MSKILKAAAVALLTASLAIAGAPFSGAGHVVKPASTGCCTM